MPKYLIYACESQYNGLHGIYDWTIEECDSAAEAEQLGTGMSIDLQESYRELMENISEQACEDWDSECDTIDKNEGEDWIDNRIDEILYENVIVEVFELRNNVNYDEIVKDDIDWDDIVNIYGINS